MTTKIIEITVNPQGETKIETKGFTGGSCRAASKTLEQVLGQQATEQMTAEFYQTESVGQSQKTQG